MLRRRVAIGLPSGESVRQIGNSMCKDLGYLKIEITVEKEMKKRLKVEYYTRVRLLLRSKLYDGKVIKAMNSWAVLEIRYTAAIIEWIKKELKAINIKTRKMMAMAGELHQKGNSDRLYLLTKKLRRRMISVEDCVELEGKKKYMMGSKKRLFGVVG